MIQLTKRRRVAGAAKPSDSVRKVPLAPSISKGLDPCPAPPAAPTHARKRKRILKRASGFRAGPGTIYRQALEFTRKADVYAYRDRRQKKRHFRTPVDHAPQRGAEAARRQLQPLHPGPRRQRASS